MAVKPYNDNTLNAGESLRHDNIIVHLMANTTITKGEFVELVPGGHAKTAGATIGGAVGIALQDAASGDSVPVVISGIATVTTDATGVQMGGVITSDASGHATAATYGTDTVIGLAVSTGAANGAVSVLLGGH